MAHRSGDVTGPLSGHFAEVTDDTGHFQLSFVTETRDTFVVVNNPPELPIGDMVRAVCYPVRLSQGIADPRQQYLWIISPFSSHAFRRLREPLDMSDFVVDADGVATLRLTPGELPIAIPAFEPISVPSGLTVEHVEVAILAVLADIPIPKGFSDGAAVAARAMTAFFSPSTLKREWYPYSRRAGRIMAGESLRSRHLQVHLDFDTSSIRSSIFRSRNLQQNKKSIHPDAIEWIHQLEDRSRRSFDCISSYRPSRSTEQQ